MYRKLFLFSIMILLTIGIIAQVHPKREFRGAWIHTVGNEQFKTMTSDSIKTYLSKTLDDLKRAGVNAVIFQVRPQADAFYKSELEPWSRFLTGVQGQAPVPFWDPLQFMIEECHKRGMELHAWCNPYRVTSNDKEQLTPEHLYFKKPELFKKYGKQLYFDPGEPESIKHTVKVIADIVSRYDVDAIHFDDYFYPTTDPAFDAADYAASGTALTQDDWRRENVNALVELSHAAARRYGVRFGVAPVGDPEQNYALQYSDAARWLRQGTVDYLMPQLYWGQEYVKDGDTSHSLARLAGAWAALPRAAGVRLYAGLGAYRIGAGDGSDAGSEWVSGRALADQLNLLDRLGVQGAGLYRYASLFDASDYAGLAAAEVDAVRQVWQIDQRSKD